MTKKSPREGKTTEYVVRRYAYHVPISALSPEAAHFIEDQLRTKHAFANELVALNNVKCREDEAFFQTIPSYAKLTADITALSKQIKELRDAKVDAERAEQDLLESRIERLLEARKELYKAQNKERMTIVNGTAEAATVDLNEVAYAESIADKPKRVRDTLMADWRAQRDAELYAADPEVVRLTEELEEARTSKSKKSAEGRSISVLKQDLMRAKKNIGKVPELVANSVRHEKARLDIKHAFRKGFQQDRQDGTTLQLSPLFGDIADITRAEEDKARKDRMAKAFTEVMKFKRWTDFTRQACLTFRLDKSPKTDKAEVRLTVEGDDDREKVLRIVSAQYGTIDVPFLAHRPLVGDLRSVDIVRRRFGTAAVDSPAGTLEDDVYRYELQFTTRIAPPSPKAGRRAKRSIAIVFGLEARTDGDGLPTYTVGTWMDSKGESGEILLPSVKRVHRTSTPDREAERERVPYIDAVNYLNGLDACVGLVVRHITAALRDWRKAHEADIESVPKLFQDYLNRWKGAVAAGRREHLITDTERVLRAAFRDDGGMKPGWAKAKDVLTSIRDDVGTHIKRDAKGREVEVKRGYDTVHHLRSWGAFGRKRVQNSRKAQYLQTSKDAEGNILRVGADFFAEYGEVRVMANDLTKAVPCVGKPGSGLTWREVAKHAAPGMLREAILARCVNTVTSVVEQPATFSTCPKCGAYVAAEEGHLSCTCGYSGTTLQAACACLLEGKEAAKEPKKPKSLKMKVKRAVENSEVSKVGRARSKKAPEKAEVRRKRP